MLFDLLISLVNRIISGAGTAITWILSLLPDSPFLEITSSYSDLTPALEYFTYFVPVGTMITHFIGFLSILLLYYGYRVVLNWLKVLEG